MNLQFFIKFEGDTTYTEITEYIKYDSIRIEKSLFSKKFNSVQDSIKAKTIFDETINAKFNEATTWMEAYVISDEELEPTYGYNSINTYGYDTDIDYGFAGTGNLFTGAIYPNTKEVLRDPTIEGISFEIVDNSYLLDKDNAEFQYPAVIGDPAYKVFDPSDKTHSIIHQLLYSAGILDSQISTNGSITETVEYIAEEAGKKSYLKLIDKLLYEFHHVFYFDENGIFNIYNWKHSTIDILDTITNENILNTKGIARERNIIDHDGYKIKYDIIDSKIDKLLYRKVFDEDGKLLLAGQAYPTDGETKDIYQKFSSNWLAEDAKILATSNQSVDAVYDTDIDIITENYEAKKAQIVFKNNGSVDRRIYTFDIRGDAVYKSGDAERIIPLSAVNTEDKSADYIHTSEQADDFGEALYNNIVLHGKYLYSFESEQEYLLGHAVNIITDMYDVNAITYGKTYDPYKKFYTYKLIGAGVHVAQSNSGSENESAESDEPKNGEYTEFQYARNTSKVNAPTEGWQSTPPTLGDYEFLWMQSRIVDSYGIAGAWTSAVRISGVPGVPGEPGNDGNSLYTWVVYADDDAGTGISIYPQGKGFIGYAYNRISSVIETGDPSIYEWSPYFLDLIVTDLEITGNGQIRAGYDEAGNPPADEKGFFIDADGRMKGQLAEFENSKLSGSFLSKSMDILDSLGAFSIDPSNTGIQVANNFSNTPAGFTKITGFGSPNYTGSSGNMVLEDLSVITRGDTPSNPISMLPNNTLITSGAFKRSTNQGTSWSTLTPPSLPAVPTAPHSWSGGEDYATYLIGDNIWAFSRKRTDYWTTTYQQPHQRYIQPVYYCTIPETGHTITQSAPCPEGYVETGYVDGYWETYYTTETSHHYVDYYWTYVYIGGSWHLASSDYGGKIAGYSYGTKVYLVVEGHIINSTDSGSNWSVHGTTAVLEQNRFITFPGSSKIAHITSSGAYITSDGASYSFDSSIKPSSELYLSDTIILNLGSSIKYSVNGGAFQQKDLPVNADCIAKVDSRCIVKSGSYFYMGYDWDAMKKCDTVPPASWQVAINGNVLSHSLSKTTISKTIYKDTTDVYWVFYSNYLKIYIDSDKVYEMLILTTSSSACGYTLNAFALDSGVQLKKSIQVVESDVDIGPLRTVTATTVTATTVTGTTVYGAVGNDIVDHIEAPKGWTPGFVHLVNHRYYGIPSDTSSIHAGEVTNHTMPRAVAGFVLMYVDKEYQVNTPLTYKWDRTLTKKRWWMRRPVIALYYKCPENKIWNKVRVNGRHIVKVVF